MYQQIFHVSKTDENFFNVNKSKHDFKSTYTD